MTSNSRRQAIEQVPLAVAYGDAAGLPVETRSAEQIAERYGWIDRLIEPSDNPFFEGEWPAGTTSDDTQLTVVVARSLVRAGRFDVADQANAHIDIYRETPRITTETGKMITRAWGRSTTEAVERMIDGVSPHESGQEMGAGNGVVMKLAPLAIWNSLRQLPSRTVSQSYDELTTMTHDSDIARLTTRLHGDVLKVLIEDGSAQDIPGAVLPYLNLYRHDHPQEMALLARAIESPCQSFAELVERYAAGKSGFKYGFYVPETLAITYDIFLGSQGNYQDAVFRAVNLGGDADSTASIVSTMCVLAGGVDLPDDSMLVQDRAELQAMGGELYSVTSTIN